MGTTIIIAIVTRIFEDQIFSNQLVSRVDLFSNLDYFAISGLLGYMVAVNYKRVAQLVNRIPQWGRWAYIIMVLLMLYYLAAIFEHDTWFLKVFDYTIKAIIFTGLLLVFIPQDSKIRFSEKNIFTKLGKISYGLYVYHIVWVHVIYKFYIDYGIEVDTLKSYGLFVFITFTGTVITAYLSYRYFEKPILKLREKYFSN